MNRTVADIIFSAIIGDAAGYTFNGMKKNHIKAVFKDITGYTDPAPALRDNMQKWKKPGLYSSITQNMLITAACTDKRTFNFDEYIKAVKNSPEVAGVESGIFRDPGEAERNFFFRAKNDENSGHHFIMPCSRLLPPVLSLLLIKNEKEHLISTVKYISLFTKSSSTIACSILLLQLIKDLIAEEGTGILQTALHSAEKAKNEIIANQGMIFDSGHNPDYIISEADSLFELFRELNTNKNTADYEKMICTYADKKKTNTITRGSVNLPETILPMAIILSDSCSDPERIFSVAVREGGAASSLTALSAAITAAYHGVNIPEVFINTLANKKRISAMIDLIAEDKNRASIITEIYAAEPGLTAKEYEEHRAKNKNIPVTKEKKKKTRGEIESELSKHVVESWTKLDKAKWKKERKKENS
ncbi:MAG TPA: ADP-ribosylglycohydrolase family protein [Spirochaetota bacterium]|nr:ADP-ribosylglycohydrolase family protein [Spirochaetota bacterium]